MVPAPEMAAFAERFGFEFRAHRIGDANRSAHVERFFDHIENNFLGRAQLRRLGGTQRARRGLGAIATTHACGVTCTPARASSSPTERLQLRPLPLHVPEVYRLHQRIVDTEGYVNVWRNRYSVPWQLIGRTRRGARDAAQRSRSSTVRGSSPRIDAVSMAATSE